MQEKYTLSDIRISDELYNNFQMAYMAMEDKENILSPEEARTCPSFVVTELLQKVCDFEYKKDYNASNSAFAEYLSVLMNGVNPLKSSQLKNAGIDPEYWSYVVKTLHSKVG